MSNQNSEKKYLDAAKRIFTHLAETADANISIQLWDGSHIPLGDKATEQWNISIKGPEVLGAILRRPTLENFLRQYASGNIDFNGGNLIDFYEVLRTRGSRTKEVSSSQIKKRLNKGYLLRQALPLLFAKKIDAAIDHTFQGDDKGRVQSARDEKSYIQFHYDLSNDFYKLFLDPEMQYSCAYFTSWEQDLEQAQQNKLDMICRKLQLQPGDRFLDIGCGWGGLLCHAVTHFKVIGHGVTLSQRQYDFALEKIRRRGLDDRITIELRDYRELTGEYDKIASIGMYEHIGIANYATYFQKLNSLLRDRGILLNHGITRRAKHSQRQFARITVGRRFILKYIFPGSELDHIGHTLSKMEACGFEVHDVEAWREHYARTTRLWCQRLEDNKDKAIEQVGKERYRMWIAYLAGVSFAFLDGSLRIFQTVATKHGRKGPSTMPPTRRHLY
ncbi:MAG: cyclopropane-fatty-acyl-phospholipid synthase [Desulfocapsaceae bacterium]|nr:cyclopropane-fatty-acyl-phospholipid synthase [Desulfocapsaceae bacterium]